MTFLGQGYLAAGQYQDVVYMLQAGMTYFIAVQTPDAAAFDLDLFDENANKVDTSPVIGAVAGCQVTPMWTGPFTFRIICRQGVGRFTLVGEP